MQQASRDTALKGAPLNVYVWLVYNLLDPDDYSPIKIQGVAVAMRIDKETASRAVRLLVDRGYLVRRYVERRGYEYRLRYNRKEAA